MESVEAAKARGPLKKMLLGGGGSAQVHVGDTTRMLYHSFLHQPMQKLPWPLSLIHPHNLGYVRRQSEKTVEMRTFTKWQINEAIDLLLEGLDPSQLVLIMPGLSSF